MNVRKTEVATSVTIGEVLVVKTEQVKDCGVKIVDTYWILHRFEAKFIGRPVDGAAADSSACHPDGKAVVVVITTRASFGNRRASKFAAPNDQCVIEHAACFEVGQQGCDWAIDLPGKFTMIAFNI